MYFEVQFDRESTIHYLDTSQVEYWVGMRMGDKQVSEEWTACTQDGLVDRYLLVVGSYQGHICEVLVRPEMAQDLWSTCCKICGGEENSFVHGCWITRTERMLGGLGQVVGQDFQYGEDNRGHQFKRESY